MVPPPSCGIPPGMVSPRTPPLVLCTWALEASACSFSAACLTTGLEIRSRIGEGTRGNEQTENGESKTETHRRRKKSPASADDLRRRPWCGDARRSSRSLRESRERGVRVRRPAISGSRAAAAVGCGLPVNRSGWLPGPWKSRSLHNPAQDKSVTAFQPREMLMKKTQN